MKDNGKYYYEPCYVCLKQKYIFVRTEIDGVDTLKLCPLCEGKGFLKIYWENLDTL